MMAVLPLPRSPVFFDLDGTLADSAPGIVASLDHALTACGIDAAAIDWQRYIGPPLPQMITTALPHLAEHHRDAVITTYRKHYSCVGLFMTAPFPGIAEQLAMLARLNSQIFVVTNKPQGPAEAILAHMQIDRFIHRVVGGDPTGRITKPDRAVTLVAEEGLKSGIFIGDGLDDLHAAERIGARFLLAGWGYGVARVLAERPDVMHVPMPKDLFQLLSPA